MHESYRRQGIGRGLLETAIGACPSLRIDALHLLVAPDNMRARLMYEQRGFTEEDRRILTLWIGPKPKSEQRDG